jgi:hypothetical protein
MVPLENFAPPALQRQAQCASSSSSWSSPEASASFSSVAIRRWHCSYAPVAGWSRHVSTIVLNGTRARAGPDACCPTPPGCVWKELTIRLVVNFFTTGQLLDQWSLNWQVAEYLTSGKLFGQWSTVWPVVNYLTIGQIFEPTI